MLCELELELIQSHMAQKPMLRGEVGARALRARSVSREEAWASTGVYYLASSFVVVGVEDPPFGDPGCALRHRPAPVLWSHPDVVPWLPHEGLANGEGGRGREPVPPGAVLRQACSLLNTARRSKHELEHLFQLQL